MFWALLIFSLATFAEDFENPSLAFQYDPSRVLSFVEELKSLPAQITNPETSTSIIENHHDSDSIYRGKIIRKLNPEGQWQIEVLSVEFRFMRVTMADPSLKVHFFEDCRYSRDWGEAYLYWRRSRGNDSHDSREIFEAHLHPEIESIFSNCEVKKASEYSHSIRNEALNLTTSESSHNKDKPVMMTTKIFLKKTGARLESLETSHCIEYRREPGQNFTIAKKCNPTDEAADFWTDLNVLENFREPVY